MKLILVLLCLTLLNIGSTLPQQSSDWPPDPASLFTDAVKIIHTESENRSGLLVDSLNRQIVSADGREFPWPDSIEDVDTSQTHLIIGGTLYFSASPRGDTSSDWQLDLKTGQYTPKTDDRVFTQCGTIRLGNIYRTYPWIMQYRSKHWQFCEITTGSLSVPLPTGYVWLTGAAVDGSDQGTEAFSFFSYDPGPVASPNGKWLLILGYRVQEGVLTAYAFELNTGQFNKLGGLSGLSEGGDSYDYHIFEWHDDREVRFFCSGMREWSSRDEYIADVTRPNSLELTVHAFRFAASSLDNPPRREVFLTQDTSGAVIDKCTRDIYDIQNHTRATYEYPVSMCVTEYGPFDGDGYYRDVSADQTSATLVRYNPVTRQRVALYQGEIESVLWVSPDEHYAALILDNNGRIDTIPGEEPMDAGLPLITTGDMLILDLSSGATLYRLPAGRVSFHTMLPSLKLRRQQAYSSAAYGNRALYFWFPFVETVGPDSLLLIDNKEIPKVPEDPKVLYGPAFRLLHVESKRVTISDIPVSGDIPTLQPGDGRLFIWTGGEDKSTALSLYDPATSKVTPLIKTNDKYTVFLLKASAGTLTVVVTPRGQDQGNFLHKMTYQLQLPN